MAPQAPELTPASPANFPDPIRGEC